MSRPRPRGPGKRRRHAKATRPAGQPQRSKSEPTPDGAAASDSIAAVARSAGGEGKQPRRHKVTRGARSEAAVLGTAPTRTGIKPATVALSIQREILACAVLYAVGATLGVIAVLGEMRYHVLSPAWCGTSVLAALCVGTVLGLYVPQRIIRRHLTRAPGDVSKESAPAVVHARDLKLEFAASLAGGLIIAFALTWVVLCVGMVLMEEYRSFVMRRFSPPVWLSHLLLSGPPLAGLVVAGATGTTLLVAMHGWYRLVSQPEPRITRLWGGILAGVMAAGLLAGQITSPVALAVLAPLALFSAGAVAVLRHSDAVATLTPASTRVGLPQTEWLSLLTAGLAAGLVAIALGLTISAAGATLPNLPVHAVVLAGAAGAGLLGARLIVRLGLSTELAAAALLLGAIALLMPYQHMTTAAASIALLRLGVVTGCAAACVVLVSRRIARRFQSMQATFAWVGRFAAGGFGLMLVLWPTSMEAWDPAAIATAVAIAATVGAGATLVLSQRMKTVPRIAGLVGIAVWLMAVPAARRTLAETLLAHEAQPQHVSPEPLVRAARRFVTADPFRSAQVRPLPPSADGAGSWQVDLAGPALDLVIIESTGGEDHRPISDDDWGSRLLRRIGTRLARGGRLLVELPTPPHFAEALEQLNRASGAADWAGYRLRVRGERSEVQALVFGRDIPALIERNRRGSELEVSLEAMGSPRSLKD